MPLQETIQQKVVRYALEYQIEPNTALRIAKAESNFRADAINHNKNGSNDVGVFQINSIHKVPDICRLDAECNIRWAMETMQKVGTQPWYSSAHKWK